MGRRMDGWASDSTLGSPTQEERSVRLLLPSGWLFRYSSAVCVLRALRRRWGGRWGGSDRSIMLHHCITTATLNRSNVGWRSPGLLYVLERSCVPLYTSRIIMLWHLDRTIVF